MKSILKSILISMAVASCSMAAAPHYRINIDFQKDKEPFQAFGYQTSESYYDIYFYEDGKAFTNNSYTNVVFAYQPFKNNKNLIRAQQISWKSNCATMYFPATNMYWPTVMASSQISLTNNGERYDFRDGYMTVQKSLLHMDPPPYPGYDINQWIFNVMSNSMLLSGELRWDSGSLFSPIGITNILIYGTNYNGGSVALPDIVGPAGKDGTNGYTPVKGVDYFDGTNGANGSNGLNGVLTPDTNLWNTVSNKITSSDATNIIEGYGYVKTNGNGQFLTNINASLLSDYTIEQIMAVGATYFFTTNVTVYGVVTGRTASLVAPTVTQSATYVGPVTNGQYLASYLIPSDEMPAVLSKGVYSFKFHGWHTSFANKNPTLRGDLYVVNSTNGTVVQEFESGAVVIPSSAQDFTLLVNVTNDIARDGLAFVLKTKIVDADGYGGDFESFFGKPYYSGFTIPKVDGLYATVSQLTGATNAFSDTVALAIYTSTNSVQKGDPITVGQSIFDDYPTLCYPTFLSDGGAVSWKVYPTGDEFRLYKNDDGSIWAFPAYTGEEVSYVASTTQLAAHSLTGHVHDAESVTNIGDVIRASNEVALANYVYQGQTNVMLGGGITVTGRTNKVQLDIIGCTNQSSQILVVRDGNDGNAKFFVNRFGATTLSSLTSYSIGNWSLDSAGSLTLSTGSSYLLFNTTLYGSGSSGIIRTPVTIRSQANQTLLNINPTYAQTNGIATNTDVLVNRTETSLSPTAGVQRLISLQVGGVERFGVNNKGATKIIGASDDVQLSIQANATQNSNVFAVVGSDGLTKASISGAGAVSSVAAGAFNSLSIGGGNSSISAGGNGAFSALSCSGIRAGFNTASPSTVGFYYVSGTTINSTGNQYCVNISPIYAQTSGLSTNIDIYINRTETSLSPTTGIQRLISAQVGGVEKFGVDNKGIVTSSNYLYQTPKWIDLMTSGMSLATGSGAPALIPTGTGKGISGMGYDTNDLGYGCVEMPHGFASTNATRSVVYIEPHVHWSMPTRPLPAANTNVLFRLIYEWSNMNGDYSVYGTNFITTNALVATNSFYSSFGNITNNGADYSSVFRFSFGRDAVIGSYTGRVVIDQIDLHVPVRELGSF